MLFAVEGGGFFSSSASGYSKGLSLLLLGHRSDDKHMRVAPWNQYQLVDQESETDLQLASGKSRTSRGCATFVCFRRASAGLDGQSPLEVGPTQPQENLLSAPTNEREKEKEESIVADDNSARIITLKSSLKKASHNASETVKKSDEQQPLAKDGSDLTGHTERRKVQWTDACGNELAEVREFELSERGESDDEFINGNGNTCSCRIM